MERDEGIMQQGRSSAEKLRGGAANTNPAASSCVSHTVLCAPARTS